MAMLTSRQVIPQEICGLICEDPLLTQPDLYALSLLSRAFRAEAERFLHISVKLSGGKRRIKSFCTKVIDRPHLVKSLHTLIVHMPPQGDLQATDLSPIMKALHLCTNLQHLHILHDGPVWMQNRAGRAMQTWILEGHEFKLKTFVTSYFSQLSLDSFLAGQPTIDTLALESARRSAVKWFISLPSLKKLSCSAEVMQVLTEIPGGRDINLEQLHLTFRNQTELTEDHFLHLLRNYRKTLRSLSITRYQNEDGMHMESLIRTIANYLPRIKFLRIMDLTGGKTPYLNHHLISLHWDFRRLKTLILHSPMMNYDSADRNPAHMISVYPDMWSEEGRLRVATRIMFTVPTLARFVFVEREVSEFVRDADDLIRITKLSTPSLDRDPDDWPRYDNTIAAYEELWKSQWCRY